MQVKVKQQIRLLDGKIKLHSAKCEALCDAHELCHTKFQTVRDQMRELAVEQGLARKSQIMWDRTLILIEGGKS